MPTPHISARNMRRLEVTEVTRIIKKMGLISISEERQQTRGTTL
jgi:hypothetical protein